MTSAALFGATDRPGADDDFISPPYARRASASVDGDGYRRDVSDRPVFVPTDVPIHPAATMMLLRDAPDGPAGIEVFMLRRTSKAAFGAGMFVFPGGRVDEADGAPEVEQYCRGLDDVEASRRLGVDAGGLAYWVAAVRESFEEAGVLLAQRLDGGPLVVDADDRHHVHDGVRSIVELCRDRALTIDLSGLHYVDHWLTPLGERRRFDTRFFLGEVPADQVLVHDDLETVDSVWVRPADGVASFSDGRWTMMPPTVANLRWLEAHDDVAGALRAAAAVESPVCTEPRLRYGADGRVVGIALPHDDDYEQLGQAFADT
jgi:8-oxo-dGTP pyrophosphatase MutT (NUDIX family)